MWSDEPNRGLHADGMSSSVMSTAAPSHPDNHIPQPFNNNSALLNPPSSPLPPPSPSPSTPSTPALHISASVPSLVAHARTSPVLRSQSRSSDAFDDDDAFPTASDNANGLFTLPPPLATTQSLFTSPAGPRGAVIPPLLRTPSVPLRDEPLTYNRVQIQYSQHVASKEMTDTANLIRQALQLRRHFVYRRKDREMTEVDVRINPEFRHPAEEVPKATQHGYLMVEGVYVAWEGEQKQPPPVADFFSHAISSPSSSAQRALAEPPASHPSAAAPSSPAFFSCPSRSDYALALSLLMDIASSGPLRSFCHNRLGLLESRFSLHSTLNGELEAVAQRAVPHRDFYNVRKTDNHVHHSSCMNQKHLLRFIKHKLKQGSDEAVIMRDGKLLSLKQVFDSLNLTPYDLSVDTLDMHANYTTFHRFDKFNLKYSPIGECWGFGTLLLMYDGSVKPVEQIVCDSQAGVVQVLMTPSGPQTVVPGTAQRGHTQADKERWEGPPLPGVKYSHSVIPRVRVGSRPESAGRPKQADGKFECKYVGCFARFDSAESRHAHDQKAALHYTRLEASPAMYRIKSADASRDDLVVTGRHKLVVRFNTRPTGPHQWPQGSNGNEPWYYHIVSVTHLNTVEMGAVSFATRAECAGALEEASAAWSPLEWVGSVDEFNACSAWIRSQAQMFIPDGVQFAPPAESLQARVERLLGRGVSQKFVCQTAWLLGVWLTDGCCNHAMIRQIAASHTHPARSHTPLILQLEAWYAEAYNLPVTCGVAADGGRMAEYTLEDDEALAADEEEEEEDPQAPHARGMALPSPHSQPARSVTPPLAVGALVQYAPPVRDGAVVTPVTLTALEDVIVATHDLGHLTTLKSLGHLLLPGSLCFRPLDNGDAVSIVVNLLGPVSAEFGKRTTGRWAPAFVRLHEAGVEKLESHGCLITKLIPGVFPWDEWAVPGSSARWAPVREASVRATLTVQPKIILALGEPVQHAWRSRFSASRGFQFRDLFFYEVVAPARIIVIECCHPSHRHSGTRGKLEQAVVLADMLARGETVEVAPHALPLLHVNQITWFAKLSSSGNPVYTVRMGPLLRALLQSYGMWSAKTLSADLNRETRDVRLALLAGIVDGDGYKHPSGLYEIPCTSVQLIEQVVFLANSLGFVGGAIGQRVKLLRGREVTYRRVCITGRKLSDVPVVLKYKAVAAAEDRGAVRDPSCAGFKISAPFHAPYYTFQLDGDGKCMLGNFVVTHNSRLREIFLKYNNHIQGQFLAEITQQVFDDLESNKYQFAEYRLSIYGSAASEWDVLANWVCRNRLFHYNVRWMIQIPRLYAVYKAAGKVQTFGELIANVFGPLFEVTVDPSSHPSLHRFLQQCVGFDIVDDESVREKPFSDHLPLPDQFDGPTDPPYAFFAFYVYSNLHTLNQLRASKGFTTFAFRPHAGEAGDAEHLACTFLLAQSINHGIRLSKSPSLQYLYYLAQVGISMSPLCNNLLFLTYDKSPFPRFFQRGLNVTLSTDDPLMVHVTKEPLVEEYSVAAQVWKLTSVDMSEIARNSVLQSGWEHEYKCHFLGNRYWIRGLKGNDIRQTNLPAIRVQFRAELLKEEMDILSQHADQPLDESLVDPL